MSKNTRTILIVVGVAIAAYLIYRWWKNKQSQGGGTSLGTNLNSMAPVLVGGSTGPSVGPGLTMPVNITITDTSAPRPGNEPFAESGPVMQQGAARQKNPVQRQRHSSAAQEPAGVTYGEGA